MMAMLLYTAWWKPKCGETLTEAVKREVAEEIGVEIIPNSLEFVIEGVYGEAFHRVDFVFYANIKDQLTIYSSR